mgnify:CR=1 FL=1
MGSDPNGHTGHPYAHSHVSSAYSVCKYMQSSISLHLHQAADDDLSSVHLESPLLLLVMVDVEVSLLFVPDLQLAWSLVHFWSQVVMMDQHLSGLLAHKIVHNPLLEWAVVTYAPY